MKQFVTVLSVTALALTVFAACGNKQESGTDSKTAQKTMVLKLGHIGNLEQPYHLAAEKFAADVKEKTKGAVEIQIFPNSQLGGQRDLLEGLQLGTIDIAFTSSAVLGNFIPTAQVIDLPFIFRDSDHVYHVVDGPLAKEIYAGDEVLGMKIISTWENGFRDMGNNVRPIHTPADMKGIKFRVMESQLYISIFESLGAIPTPMAMSEVFTALQQKTIDGIENPVVQIYASKYYEVLKYLTLTGYTYSPQIVVFSLEKWNQISPENQEIILESSAECRDYNRILTAQKTAEYIEKMKTLGIEIVELTTEQKNVFKENVLPIWESYHKVVGKELVDKVANAE